MNKKVILAGTIALVAVALIFGVLQLTGKTNNNNLDEDVLGQTDLEETPLKETPSGESASSEPETVETAVKTATRIGLHVTQEELEIWRSRAQNGPYKEYNDVGYNNPAEWQRIEKNAKAFLDNPSEERWIPVLLKGTFPDPDNIAPRSQGDKLRDAAFYYLVMGGEEYLKAVRDELIAQTSEPATDASKWSCDTSYFQNQHDPAARLIKQLFAYDYVRNDLSEDDRSLLNAWFFNAAKFYQNLVDGYLNTRFNDRFGPNKEPVNSFINHGVGGGNIAYYGGLEINGGGSHYNNRVATVMSFVGSVGIMLDNEELKQSAKEFVKEFITYAILPDGTNTDYLRWTDTSEEQGWSYSIVQGDAVLTIADHFARSGDLSLYEYVVTGGHNNAYGENKNLLLMMKNNVGYIDGTHKRYATKDPDNVGKEEYLINGWKLLGGSNQGYIYDVSWAQANIFYQDQQVKDAYTRETVPYDYPRSPLQGGYNSWGGYFGVYPSKLFMFGQMEGKVWPYPEK